MTEQRHRFIYKPGIWSGKGTMKINISEDLMPFTTKWEISEPDANGKIQCCQEVHIDGISVVTKNRFSFYDIKADAFAVDLETDALGKVEGKGLINDKTIAWELGLKELGFGGFEFYEKQQDGSYTMRAEYATSDQFRSEVRGQITFQENET